MTTISRLPEVRSLSQILPSGTEGGKEFARIVDLLLFYAANRNGNSVNLFSDRAGDYYGLDSVLENPLRKDRTTGYQYKFFPSPLSASHRAEITASLKKAIQNQKSLKLKRWILVTPDDLTESATRKDGGDVSWFASLKASLGAKFEVEHWGHRKLQALFIDTPRLCLYYYPEIVNGGIAQRKNFVEVRKIYDNNIIDANSRIEFIGMSVYKPEATHGVPIEDIYIPVSVLPYLDSGISLKTARTNPLSLLAPGARHVILGDPGSGKSTLLKFLLMVGQSERLQGRYQASTDCRLPLLVTLRKYGDELKNNKNLPLLDYICQTIQADLSIADADKEFVQYYLEAGQAIVLFDGMDELPDSSFKQLVRDRISSFLNAYPLATAIITSRIVGYSPAFGFNQNRFTHHQVAPLLIKEIECFVRDWYTARVENRQAREANISDLLRILQNPNATAIRTLSENPLLLTIVALVHRIDAVLPDERVVLYQKCTETLLNTWHVWKYKAGEDLSRRGRIERTNRRRIETLALYMHRKSGETKTVSRAILPEMEVLSILTEDILRHDDVLDIEEAKDVAADFLNFIKQKAGLLIEVGNSAYSFIHLTFQEYLAATALSVSLEMDGVKNLWEALSLHIFDPRWHEVIRLLIAGLKSDESQAYIVEQILKIEKSSANLHTAVLLGGLLIDSVKSAEQSAVEITAILFKYLNDSTSKEVGSNIVTLLQTLSTKYVSEWNDAFVQVWQSELRLRREMLLLVIGMGLPDQRWHFLTEPKHLPVRSDELQTFSLLLGSENLTSSIERSLKLRLNAYHQSLAQASRRDRYGNFTSYVGQIVFTLCGPILRQKYWLDLQIGVFLTMGGPFQDLYYNATLFSLGTSAPTSPLKEAQRNAVRNYLSYSDPKSRRISSSQAHRRNSREHLNALHKKIRLSVEELKAALQINVESKRKEQLDKSEIEHKSLRTLRESDNLSEISIHDFVRETAKELSEDSSRPIINFTQKWASVVNNHNLITRYLNFLTDILKLEPVGLWKQALQSKLMPSSLSRLPYFNNFNLSELMSNFENQIFTEADILEASSYHLYDVWLYYFDGYTNPDDSPIKSLILTTDSINHPILKAVKEIRSVAIFSPAKQEIPILLNLGVQS
ncbi:NACHT domain-containing NTPase [Herbaspirillum sp. SJZ107]|uniref:NACHT domain-containing protein n=1 Tax=Herbaspirillum sp. SJZ107 TaxID=2572881 RepID=UPI00116FB93D|nr:NACHT domain-containing protein [Herbaspirillum sp. SJZ107]TQK02787.1 NACHT domain-containing protein [Herbaspirillum sp. SJZ107]